MRTAKILIVGEGMDGQADLAKIVQNEFREILLCGAAREATQLLERTKFDALIASDRIAAADECAILSAASQSNPYIYKILISTEKNYDVLMKLIPFRIDALLDKPLESPDLLLQILSKKKREIFKHVDRRDLIDSERRYRNFFENDLTGDFLATPDGILLDYNPSFFGMLGYPDRAELIGRNITHLFANSEKWQEIIALLRETNKIENYEVMLLSKRGNTINVVKNIAASFDEDGNMSEVWGYIYDITKRMQMEEHLRIRQRMDALGTLAGGIAHDFNNILVGVLGNLDLLKMNSMNFAREQFECLNQAQSACRRAIELVRKLHSLSNGNLSIRKIVDLHEIIEEVFALLRDTTNRLIFSAA